MSGTERLGSYRIDGELGRGPFTVVMRAVHDATRRVAAIKVLRSTAGSGAAMRDPVRREAQALGRLSHGNIPQLFEFADGDAPWLARELIDGPNLRTLLDASTVGLGVPATLAVGCALALALAHAHERGVHHGGGALDDVWLTKEGTVKLSGFSHATGPGLSELGDVPAQVERRPARYLSPEELLGEPATQESDVFVVGVWLFELLSRTHPFGGDPDDPTPPRARSGDAPKLADLLDVPSGVERVVMRAIASDPQDRYPTARALYTALAETARELSIDLHEEPIRRAMVAAGLGVVRPGALAAAATEPSYLGVHRVAFGQLFVLGAMILGVFAIRTTAPSSELEEAPEVLPLAPEKPASLRIVARPWATVYVDGQMIDVTPFARPIPVKAGEHRVTLRHPVAPDEQRVVRVAQGESALVEVEMRVPPRPVAPAASSARPVSTTP